jgi:hypothetical protein
MFCEFLGPFLPVNAKFDLLVKAIFDLPVNAIFDLLVKETFDLLVNEIFDPLSNPLVHRRALVENSEGRSFSPPRFCSNAKRQRYLQNRWG